MAASFKSNQFRPPKDLNPAMRKRWVSIAGLISLDEGSASLVTALCRNIQIADDAAGVIAKEGLQVVDRFNQKRPHPALAIQRDSLNLVAKLYRALGLDLEAEQ
jgi:phage terminase small subunit